jgi:hypothetical protein
MHSRSKSLLIMAGTALSLSLGFAKLSVGNETLFCSCAENIAFDHRLPLSHPTNRCALKQNDRVSWSSWVTGRSSSYQFHFIDLLELLSRVTDSQPSNQKPPQSS